MLFLASAAAIRDHGSRFFVVVGQELMS